MFEESKSEHEHEDSKKILRSFLSRAAILLTQLLGDGDKLILLSGKFRYNNVILKMVAEATEHQGNRLIEWIQLATNSRVPSFAGEYPSELFEFAASAEGREVLTSWLNSLGEDFAVESISAYVDDTTYVCRNEAIGPNEARSALAVVETFRDAELSLTEILSGKSA